MNKSELFAAYGDDVAAALAAWPNLDPAGYAAWTASLEVAAYKREYRHWLGTQTVMVAKPTAAPKSPSLFGAPAAPDAIKVRAKITHDGETLTVAALSGHEGARKLREAAIRDKRPATTTLDRCRYYLELAERIDAETDRLGRPVTVAEVIAMEQAA